MEKPRTSVVLDRAMETHCFRDEDLRRIAAVTDLRRAAVDIPDDEAQRTAMRNAEVLITGWGSRPLTPMLDVAPNLRLVCHSAGSVRGLIDAPLFLERGIRVCTARSALATGVAEFVFGMMLVSMKAVWTLTAATSRGLWDRDKALDWVREPFGATLGIIGAGCVGREVIRLCKTLELGPMLLYDPYVSESEAEALGVVKTDLDDLMRRSNVVSLHTPAIEACRHIVNARNLALMRDRAVFINTARGMCVDEAALIVELRSGRILACLDVTDPEPPAPGSPLYELPNCILTPHVAGAVKENAFRQGRLVADQIEAYAAGRPLSGELDLAHHDRMA